MAEKPSLHNAPSQARDPQRPVVLLWCVGMLLTVLIGGFVLHHELPLHRGAVPLQQYKDDRDILLRRLEQLEKKLNDIDRNLWKLKGAIERRRDVDRFPGG